jgi:fumarate reductase (CoM/CoB) subunit A
VSGAWGIRISTGHLLLIRAKAVILSTGGMGHLFPITDNTRAITGEGYALAFRAGAELVDMEMTHFLTALCYPLGLKAGHVVERSLVAALSKGDVRLYNGLGERFMKKHDPKAGEKEKSGEALTRAIGLEICEGRASSHGGVYVDVSDLLPEMRKTLFSRLWNTLQRADLDLAFQPLELAPGPHDFLGGVKIDEKAACTVPGLFAAGEASGGAHGATRLAGSSLADALAIGGIAGRSAARYARQLKNHGPLDKRQLQDIERKVGDLLSRKEGMGPAEIKERIQNVAHRYLNVIRNADGLQKALQKLRRIEQEMLPNLSAWNKDERRSFVGLQKAIEVDGQLELAKIIASSALCRQESRGGHYGGHFRCDYPNQDDENWIKNIALSLDHGEIGSRLVSPATEE